jgi:hypothetical protein
MHKRRLLLACATALTAAFALPALADAPALDSGPDPRPFPPNTKRGKMTPGYAPDIYIDGKLRTLSPASRIFNAENLIETPASLRGKDIVVNYTEDFGGNINRIWILNADEIKQRLPTMPSAR